MNPNIKATYKNGDVEYYVTTSTQELHLPSLAFKREEDAELAVAIAKAFEARGMTYGEIGKHLRDDLKYVFRVLGFVDSPWSELETEADNC